MSDEERLRAFSLGVDDELELLEPEPDVSVRDAALYLEKCLACQLDMAGECADCAGLT